MIPLSHLALDHPEPLEGWEPLLQARGIELLTDDLHRSAIRREDARRLAEERRELERESVEKANQLQESLEGLPVPASIPALENGSPLESLMAGDPSYVSPSEEFGGRPAPRFLEEALEAGARQEAAERAASRNGRRSAMRLVDGTTRTAEEVIAAALERRVGSLALGHRHRLMLEELVSDGFGHFKAGPHVAGWVERPTPGEMRVRLLDSIEAGRTARALLEAELLDVVLSRGYPPVVRLTASA